MEQPPILKPSQWINFGYILFGVIASPLVIPFLIMVYQLLDVYFWRYEFYEDYVIERRGVFSVKRRELYFHRIKGIHHEAPFLYRIVGISNIQIVSSDPFSSFFLFAAVPKGLEISEAIREITSTGRRKKKVRELDFFQL
ncbi:PH domain-containing protein [Algoriphagus sp.]|uniref:PH domain-containing protein n=1 Tax=Algoriphagus sp. TaxID=1872435 RepID=UPI00271C2EA8|nr:PH domain-containing protein [Algoriphagus sp.]MDO8969025.1 PH domain-containing protein [Algoriphagus sp.]MDP3200256.1 PH domain-containing protein [Algoriphagus sp.]